MDEKYKNSTRLTPNDERKTDKHPHYKGHGNHTCPHCSKTVGFWASLWVNKGDDGTWCNMKTEDRDTQNLGKMVSEALGNDPLAAEANKPAPKADAKNYVPSYQQELTDKPEDQPPF